MPAPETGACEPWVTWGDLTCDVDLSHGPLGEEAMKDLVVAAATNVLYERSCRQFGLCEVTARPVPCCEHRRAFCACGRYDYVRLGTDPVASIEAVTIDGVTLDSSAYRVDEWAWLVRLDGRSWPRCNDLSVADDAPGSFSVTWTYGLEVPAEGILAAALLACHYAHQLAEACRVADNATQIAREGVTIQLAPPKPGESVGIKFVDDWLSQFHCGGGIFDAGAKRQFVRTDTSPADAP